MNVNFNDKCNTNCNSNNRTLIKQCIITKNNFPQLERNVVNAMQEFAFEF